MAKDTSKPSQLSEEFVQNSSDEDEQAMSGVEVGGADVDAAKVSNADGGAKDSDSENSDSDPDGSQESSAAESEAFSSSKKRTRDSTTATSSTPLPAAKRIKNSNFRVPAQPFKPPPGFERLEASISNQDLRAFANLDGKQIWHITAPATVDLTQVHELDIAAALQGESILITQGLSYGMQPAAEQAEVLLLPSENPVVYKQKAQVARAFRLRQVSTAAGNGADENSAALSGSASESAVSNGAQFTAQIPGKTKEPRKQPERLGYRFTPLGVERPAPEESEELRLAESILLKSVVQNGISSNVGAESVIASPEKRKTERKKKKSKVAGEIGA